MLDGVAEELSTSTAQVYSLVRSGDLEAIKIGGRGLWRVERVKLEEYIAKAYTDTALWVEANPLNGSDEPDPKS